MGGTLGAVDVSETFEKEEVMDHLIDSAVAVKVPHVGKWHRMEWTGQDGIVWTRMVRCRVDMGGELECGPMIRKEIIDEPQD